MVTNLPAKAKAKWAEAVACRYIPEKIRLMREFLAMCPKHKGTSKLIMNVKRKIAALEEELERSRTRRRSSGRHLFSVPKEGAGQIVMLGLTNVGRSSLLAALTNAKPEISPIPYTTRKPALGMLQYEDVQFQLVEAPALVEGSSEGRMDGPRILGLARNADGLLLVVDLSAEPVKQLRTLVSELEAAGILIERPEGEVEVLRQPGVGVKVVGSGSLIGCTVEDVRRLLMEYRISSALIKVRGKVGLETIEDALFSSSIYKPSIILANKADVEGSEERLKALIEEVGERTPMIAVSCIDSRGLEKVGETIFRTLGIIRVYSKEPSSREPSERPIVVEKGSKAIDVARKLHSKLYREFRYARIWGPSAKYPGEKVGPEHTMMDGDVIEVH